MGDRVAPEVQLGRVRRPIADGLQQVVALAQRASVGGHRRRGGGHRPHDQRVERMAPQRRRADDQQHVLGREEHDRQRLRQLRGSPAYAVDADALAGAGRTTAREDDLDVRRAFGPAADVGLQAGEVGAPRDHLGVGLGAMGTAHADQGDRLEQVGLAGGVGAVDHVRARPEACLETWVAAKADQGQPIYSHVPLPRLPRRPPTSTPRTAFGRA